MSKLTTAAAVTVLLALAIACDKKEEPAVADAAPMTATSGSAAPQGAGAAGLDDPSEADFEEEAERSINAANLESEITKMEAELK